MPFTIFSIFFVSAVAETTPNRAKIIYDVFMYPDAEQFIPARLVAWQASTPTANIAAGDSILCYGRAYFDTEAALLMVL